MSQYTVHFESISINLSYLSVWWNLASWKRLTQWNGNDARVPAQSESVFFPTAVEQFNVFRPLSDNVSRILNLGDLRQRNMWPIHFSNNFAQFSIWKSFATVVC